MQPKYNSLALVINTFGLHTVQGTNYFTFSFSFLWFNIIAIFDKGNASKAELNLSCV